MHFSVVLVDIFCVGTGCKQSRCITAELTRNELGNTMVISQLTILYAYYVNGLAPLILNPN